MATINVNDILFATVRGWGIEALTLRMSGVVSYAQLLSRLRMTIGNIKVGLITLTLRNSTQGWCTSRQLLMN